MITKGLGTENANGVKTTCEEQKFWSEEEEQRKLDGKEARCFRALATRANSLALDRADMQYATKEMCRGMALPMAGDMRKLRRLARYFITRPRVISEFVFQGLGRLPKDGQVDEWWCDHNR